MKITQVIEERNVVYDDYVAKADLALMETKTYFDVQVIKEIERM